MISDLSTSIKFKKWKIESGINNIFDEIYFTRRATGYPGPRFIIIITPNFISNFFYRIIAKNRYKIFGKKDSCYIPTEEELKKFITWTYFDTFI